MATPTGFPSQGPSLSTPLSSSSGPSSPSPSPSPPRSSPALLSSPTAHSSLPTTGVPSPAKSATSLPPDMSRSSTSRDSGETEPAWWSSTTHDDSHSGPTQCGVRVKCSLGHSHAVVYRERFLDGDKPLWHGNEVHATIRRGWEGFDCTGADLGDGAGDDAGDDAGDGDSDNDGHGHGGAREVNSGPCHPQSHWQSRYHWNMRPDDANPGNNKRILVIGGKDATEEEAAFYKGDQWHYANLADIKARMTECVARAAQHPHGSKAAYQAHKTLFYLKSDYSHQKVQYEEHHVLCAKNEWYGSWTLRVQEAGLAGNTAELEDIAGQLAQLRRGLPQGEDSHGDNAVLSERYWVTLILGKHALCTAVQKLSEPSLELSDAADELCEAVRRGVWHREENKGRLWA